MSPATNNLLFRHTNFQSSIINHICINSPYVQTTNGKINPPNKFQTKPAMLDMLIKIKYEEVLFLATSFLLTYKILLHFRPSSSQPSERKAVKFIPDNKK